MHTILEWAREVFTLSLELVMGEGRPLSTLTALTLLNYVLIYSMRHTPTPRRLITLWVLESTSLVLWTGCLVVLHRAGVI
jgi:hypothetical protein